MIGVTNSCNYPRENYDKTINRLVLIGNGFDLAHGFETRYTDFLLSYLNQVFKEFIHECKFEDQLIKLNYKGVFIYTDWSDKKTIKDALLFLEKIQIEKTSTLTFKSELLSNLIDGINKNKNWVDIEVEYYELLKFYIKNKNSKSIIKLNEDLQFVSELLEKYLIGLNINEINFRSDYFADFFCEKIKKDDIVTIKLSEDKQPDSLLFLNFNYTNTVENYFNKVKTQINNSEHNFIHGELNNKSNPIIFGFGDELDDEYLNLEKRNDNNLFKHIKSFKYFKTTNYHNLIRFIDSAKFQVYIIGHSCGLSDRTMLNQIFEHTNCISIKMFFYQIDIDNNDFFEKTQEISRHFKDKGMMRKKIVPEEFSFPIPKPQRMK